MRTDFGLARTSCACRLCVTNCEHLPGCLVPDDIPRMAAALGYTDHVKFAEEHLLASPGARVIIASQLVHIPTLVPARQANGHCKFLTNSRCTIHENAPVGCAYFDVHMSPKEVNVRQNLYLRRIMEAHANNEEYAQIHVHLVRLGRISRPPEASRSRMNEAIMAEGLI